MLSKEDLQKLETDHKRIAHVVGKNNAWECVFRKPTRAEYKRFRAMAHNSSTLPDAQENLARTCVVFPSPEGFDALLEDYPAIPEAAASEIGEIMGMAVDETVKG
jgi:hypothetical protein